MTLLDVDPSRALVASATGLVRGILYCTLWTSYLLKSRRVANTYPRNGEEDHLAAIFD